MRVLDAGCGSGILAIAAAKLGASGVLAVDIDPDCVRITRENAAANGVKHVVRSMLVEADDRGAFAGGRRDIIVANIVASTIIDLAAAFTTALAPEGKLIASGIIGERQREVCDALQTVGLRVEDVRAVGEWCCVEAVPLPAAAR